MEAPAAFSGRMERWILAGSSGGGGQPLGRSEDPSAVLEEGNAGVVEGSAAFRLNRTADEPADEDTLN